MARDQKHVIMIDAQGNDWASTSYGPRFTNKEHVGTRPTTFMARQVVLQLDGDVAPTLVADFNNTMLDAMPKGSFVTDVYAFSKTGADITLTIEDKDGGSSSPIDINPAANSWAAVRNVDYTTEDQVQITGTIAAGDTATVVIGYMAPESEGMVHGVIAKATV